MEPVGKYTFNSTSSVQNGVEEYPTIGNVVNLEGKSVATLQQNGAVVGINFTPMEYNVTIAIKSSSQLDTGGLHGMPVKIDGETVYSQYSFASGSYSPARLMLPNGTYQYSAENLTGYHITDSWGYLNVSGGPASVTVTYKYTRNQNGQ